MERRWALDLEMRESGAGDLFAIFEAVFDPKWRDIGVSPALIGSAIHRLSGGCAAVAVQPWPFAGSVLHRGRPPGRLSPPSAKADQQPPAPTAGDATTGTGTQVGASRSGRHPLVPEAISYAAA